MHHQESHRKTPNSLHISTSLFQVPGSVLTLTRLGSVEAPLRVTLASHVGSLPLPLDHRWLSSLCLNEPQELNLCLV